MTNLLDYLPLIQVITVLAGAFMGANMALLPSAADDNRRILPIARFALSVGFVYGLLPITAAGDGFPVVLAAFVVTTATSFGIARYSGALVSVPAIQTVRAPNGVTVNQ